MELLINAQREIWNDCISLRFGQRNQKSLSVAKPLLFVEQPENSLCEPALRLDVTEAQRLNERKISCRSRTGSSEAQKEKTLIIRLTSL